MKLTSLRPETKYEKEAKNYEINKPYVQQRKIKKLLIKSNCYEIRHQIIMYGNWHVFWNKSVHVCNLEVNLL